MSDSRCNAIILVSKKYSIILEMLEQPAVLVLGGAGEAELEHQHCNQDRAKCVGNRSALQQAESRARIGRAAHHRATHDEAGSVGNKVDREDVAESVA